jgi:hypothetical protein
MSCRSQKNLLALASPKTLFWCPLVIFIQGAQLQILFQVEKVRIEIQPMHDLMQKHHEMPGSVANADLDIPESVGLSTPQPSSVRRLIDTSSVRRNTRRRVS